MGAGDGKEICKRFPARPAFDVNKESLKGAAGQLTVLSQSLAARHPIVSPQSCSIVSAVSTACRYERRVVIVAV